MQPTLTQVPPKQSLGYRDRAPSVAETGSRARRQSRRDSKKIEIEAFRSCYSGS